MRLLPEVLYETNSIYNKDIKVIRIGKTTKLIVDGFVQSISESSRFAKKRVWGKVAQIIKKRKPNAKNILLLGMGAGTMVHMLNNRFPSENIEITSVEIDKTISDIANKYFGLYKVKNNKVIVADAYKFLRNPKNYNIQNQFDVVIVDTYCGDNYPENISSEIFLSNLFEIVAKDGFVVFNKVILRIESLEIDKFKKLYSNYLNSLNVTKINCKGISDNYLFQGFKKT